jgi:hypothetical protein
MLVLCLLGYQRRVVCGGWYGCWLYIRTSISNVITAFCLSPMRFQMRETWSGTSRTSLTRPQFSDDVLHRQLIARFTPRAVKDESVPSSSQAHGLGMTNMNSSRYYIPDAFTLRVHKKRESRRHDRDSRPSCLPSRVQPRLGRRHGKAQGEGRTSRKPKVHDVFESFDWRNVKHALRFHGTRLNGQWTGVR